MLSIGTRTSRPRKLFRISDHDGSSSSSSIIVCCCCCEAPNLAVAALIRSSSPSSVSVSSSASSSFSFFSPVCSSSIDVVVVVVVVFCFASGSSRRKAITKNEMRLAVTKTNPTELRSSSLKVDVKGRSTPETKMFMPGPIAIPKIRHNESNAVVWVCSDAGTVRATYANPRALFAAPHPERILANRIADTAVVVLCPLLFSSSRGTTSADADT
mmetsp:Transcript_7816/g.19399  ORF Transcript_7816/g.19399 Transcript_7816/m.19399 type:complete len:214 (+) Transcript_7816:1032-1673(+)